MAVNQKKPRMDCNEQSQHVHGISPAPHWKEGNTDIDMSAPITADFLIRAGGLGARDDIGSITPVAMDATDFEEEILSFENYTEDKEEKKNSRHPGLGSEQRESESDEMRSKPVDVPPIPEPETWEPLQFVSAGYRETQRQV